MIEIRYLQAESGANKFGTCNCCGKSSGEDPLMISIKFSYYGHGTLICLCDDCRKKLIEVLNGEQLPPAQPERRCVNCGRTVNNGGWYEDGRTRCPIEEHYALPKDGYCHLWEKRKDWEDDYVKRAEEGEK